MDIAVNLFCIPFAGGNAHSYRVLHEQLTQPIYPYTLELPGRGKRIREPLEANLEVVADDLFYQIKGLANDKPYAIYGHSMGAMLGFLMIQRLREYALPMPVHFFVGSARAPSVLSKTPTRYHLDRESLYAQVNAMGGLPQELLESEELLDFFEPMIRNDLKALETYGDSRYPPIDVPITCLIGQHDAIPREHMLVWQQETLQPCHIVEYNGGHFFIFEYPKEIGQLISQTLGHVS